MYKPSITCYKIYRLKHEDFMWLEERNISLKENNVLHKNFKGEENE